MDFLRAEDVLHICARTSSTDAALSVQNTQLCLRGLGACKWSYGRPLSPWFEKVSFGQRRGIHKVATCELFVLKDRIAIAKSEPEDQDCNAQSASTASEGTDILIILAGSIRVVLQIFLKRRSRFEGLDGEDYNGMGARSARLSLCYVVVLILGDLAARTWCFLCR